MPADTPRPSPRCSEEGLVTQTCTLLTLAGEKLPIEVDPNARAGFRGFEKAVLAELPYFWPCYINSLRGFSKSVF